MDHAAHTGKPAGLLIFKGNAAASAVIVRSHFSHGLYRLCPAAGKEAASCQGFGQHMDRIDGTFRKCGMAGDSKGGYLYIFPVLVHTDSPDTVQLLPGIL